MTFNDEYDWRILHATARRHSWKGEGWLSIKKFSGGRAHYSVGAGHHAVDDCSYLVLNHGRNYLIHLDSPKPVESFCIFFAPTFAADALRAATQKANHLLDLPEDARRPVDFFEKTYPHDEILSPLLHRLQRTHRDCDAVGLEEQMHGIIAALLKAHGLALRDADRLENVRSATRRELYRRAARARDYADAMFAEPLSLKEIARVAALSPNHLLRTFAQIYRQTPHNFLTTRRLNEASRLLIQGELSVTEICFAVGFQSLGSFSSLFKRRFGLSPAQYRISKK